MRAGDWGIFSDNWISAKKQRGKAGGVELNYIAETNTGVRMWGLNWASKNISTAAAGGRRFPVTDVG